MQQLLELQQQPKELRTQLFMQLMWNSDDHNRVTPLLAATCKKGSTTMKALLEAGASKHSAKPSTSGFVNFQGPTVHCYTFHCYTKRPGHLQVITHRLREVFKSSTVLGLSKRSGGHPAGVCKRPALSSGEVKTMLVVSNRD